MVQRFDKNQSREIVDASQFLRNAQIDLAQADNPELLRVLELNFSVARSENDPMKIPFAFQSLYIREASDAGVELKVKFQDRESNDVMSLSKNDVLEMDYTLKNVYLFWDAQPNKTMKIFFILAGKFRPGSLFTQVSSAVDGNAINVSNAVNVGLGPVKIADQDSSRTVLRISSSLGLEIGSTALGPFFPIGLSDQLRNTAEVWAVCPTGTAVVQTMEEK